MKKKLILKDNETGRYFTNDYHCWWSRDIKDAYLADGDSEFLKIIYQHKENEIDEAFEKVDWLVVETIFCR